MISIGELSKKTGVSIRTLRYYDEIDLLKPAMVAESGYRYYSENEVILLKHIVALKELGLKLAHIKSILSKEEGSGEHRWSEYVDYELAKVEENRARLDKLERFLRIVKHAYEMNGEIRMDDVYVFIKSLQTPPELRREEFLARYFSEEEREIIRNLPKLSEKDPRSMKWAQLIRKVKEHIQANEPPSSPQSQKLAAEIMETTLGWFNNNIDLLDRYWTLIRPEEGMKEKVFALDAEVMNYIDQIVDVYLQKEEKNEHE